MGISGEEKDFVERTAKALAEFNKRGYPAICGIGWGAIRTYAVSEGFEIGKIQNVSVPILTLYQAVYGKITASRHTIEKNDIQDIINISPLIEKVCSVEEIQMLYEVVKEKNCQELISCF
jgi:hypothetical protein